MSVTIEYGGVYCTDEELVEFYNCSCGFERVPRLQDGTFAKQYGDPETMTARYCPGCGKEVVWVDKYAKS